MKSLLPRIALMVVLIAATAFGFILLITKASTHSTILILGAALFLFGSWGAVALTDGFFRNTPPQK